MSTDAIRETLESKVQTDFAALQPSVPAKFLNTRFDTPTGPWIHVAVLPSLVKRANLGSQEEFQSFGVVNVTCMVPENTSTKTARAIADSVWTILADRQIPLPAGGHISTYETEFRDRGVVSGWYTVNVLVKYRARVRLTR